MRLTFTRVWRGIYQCVENDVLKIRTMAHPGHPDRVQWVTIVEGDLTGPFDTLQSAKDYLQRTQGK